MRVNIVVAAVLSVGWVAAVPPAAAQWTRWGGPNQDFTCDAGTLATSWGETGPAEVWTRSIGPGHSTVLVDDGTAYTMYRHGDQDVVVAVDAASGEVRWEHRYDAPAEPGMLDDYGSGPHSSPLIVDERLFTVGSMTHLFCFEKASGKVLWSRNLHQDLGVSPLLRGYGSSPVAYRDLLILSTGTGRSAEVPSGLSAFRQDTGELVWSSERFSAGYPTPVLVNLGGQDMLIDGLGITRFALDPATGTTLWKTQVGRQSGSIITSPLWIPPDRVLFSAGHGGGTRLLRISAAGDDGFSVEELWYYNKLRIMHGNAVRIGDHVYGSSGDLGPAYLMAVDLADGSLAWRERGFAKATLLLADGKLVILDEEGNLAVATASPERLQVHCRAKVLEQYAWTAPTLVGTRLYLRDDHVLRCLDLGVDANRGEEVKP